VGKAVLKKKHLETVHESVQPSTTTPETVPEVLETAPETPENVPETASGTPETAVGTATETPGTAPETAVGTAVGTVGDDRKQEVIRLYSEGKSYNQIVNITKIPKGTVSRILREAGLADLDPSEIKMEFRGLKEALTVNISNTMQRIEALERRFDELKAVVAAGRGPPTAVPPAVSTTVPGNNPSNPPEGKEGLLGQLRAHK
jgi:hypothetical protein